MSRREVISIVVITALVVSTLVVLYLYLDARHRYESLLEYVKRGKIEDTVYS